MMVAPKVLCSQHQHARNTPLTPQLEAVSLTVPRMPKGQTLRLPHPADTRRTLAVAWSLNRSGCTILYRRRRLSLMASSTAASCFFCLAAPSAASPSGVDCSAPVLLLLCMRREMLKHSSQPCQNWVLWQGAAHAALPLGSSNNPARQTRLLPRGPIACAVRMGANVRHESELAKFKGVDWSIHHAACSKEDTAAIAAATALPCCVRACWKRVQNFATLHRCSAKRNICLQSSEGQSGLHNRRCIDAQGVPPCAVSASCLHGSTRSQALRIQRPTSCHVLRAVSHRRHFWLLLLQCQQRPADGAGHAVFGSEEAGVQRL